MSQLTKADKDEIWAEVMAHVSGRREVVEGITKQELRQVVESIDSWITAVTPSFLDAVPTPSLTIRQKLSLFVRVLKKRWEVS